MQGKHNSHATADKTGRWNENKMMSADGYIKIRVGKSHPLADPNGYAYEHLLIWISAGKTKPKLRFLLHHKNHVKTDNRIENLEEISLSEHNRIHNATKGRNSKGQFCGKKKAGRIIDGRTWDEYPKTEAGATAKEKEK